jgi:predicted aldo/keto reductase-like oxidoreductase
MNMYRTSFKRLQTDYIDYYLLHSVGSVEDIKSRFLDNGMLDFLMKEREAGRIRNLGWSFHGSQAAFDRLLEMNKDIHWDFAQIQMNYVDWKHAGGRNVKAEYLYNELAKHNVPGVIMEPLLGGRLARLNRFAYDILRKLNPNESPASWAFRFAGTPKNILTVLSGMTYMEHLQEDIRIYSPLKPVNEEEQKALEEAAVMLSNSDMIPCTECQYCMPCPYGLNIPAIFAHYNLCLNEDLLPKDKQDPNYRKARQAYLVGYDRSVPKLRQASHCIECNICLPKCPQRIRIPQEMRRINEYTEKLKQGKL